MQMAVSHRCASYSDMLVECSLEVKLGVGGTWCSWGNRKTPHNWTIRKSHNMLHQDAMYGGWNLLRPFAFSSALIPCPCGRSEHGGGVKYQDVFGSFECPPILHPMLVEFSHIRFHNYEEVQWRILGPIFSIVVCSMQWIATPKSAIERENLFSSS